jgi:multidrug transporter EmrE-like cation transporter
MDRILDYSYIAGTILLTVYGQLIVKWQVNMAGALPADPQERIWFLVGLVLNPWIISSFLAAFLAALSWMAAMTKFNLSHAYPFMSLSFVLVLALSGLVFHEAVTLPKILGIILIMAGIVVGSQG